MNPVPSAQLLWTNNASSSYHVKKSQGKYLQHPRKTCQKHRIWYSTGLSRVATFTKGHEIMEVRFDVRSKTAALTFEPGFSAHHTKWRNDSDKMWSSMRCATKEVSSWFLYPWPFLPWLLLLLQLKRWRKHVRLGLPNVSWTWNL